MPDAAWLAAALLCAQLGMIWLALAMDVHWKQVHAAPRAPSTVLALRSLGCMALAASLACCLLADTGTMAVLVWMMLLPMGAAITAFVLSWRPRALAWSWLRDAGSE
jgi:hypothetical protein